MRDHSLLAKNKIPRPIMDGDYKNVYVPKGCIWEGVEGHYQKGKYYDTWISNDHGFVKGEDGWHILGITHPLPEDYIDDYHDGLNVHANEEQLFHGWGKGTFKELLRDDAYEECPKVLYPDERPNEAPAIHAPHIIEADEGYTIVYGPIQMRYATSADLKTFKAGGVYFESKDTARDPNVFVDDDGTTYMIYAFENKVCYRSSKDMKEWSKEMVMQVNPFNNGTSESPFMIKRDGIYYLFWCIWDETCGSYDNRTFVFGSDKIDGFEGLSPLTILPAHAPEIIKDEDGDYYISSAYYPFNGISVAPIRFE